MCCLGYEYNEGESQHGPQERPKEKVTETANNEVEAARDKLSDVLSPEIVCCPTIQTVQKAENIPAASENKDGEQKPEGTGAPKRRRRRRHRRRGPKKDE